jgi:hypothetical protein
VAEAVQDSRWNLPDNGGGNVVSEAVVAAVAIIKSRGNDYDNDNEKKNEAGAARVCKPDVISMPEPKLQIYFSTAKMLVLRPKKASAHRI